MLCYVISFFVNIKNDQNGVLDLMLCSVTFSYTAFKYGFLPIPRSVCFCLGAKSASTAFICAVLSTGSTCLS